MALQPGERIAGKYTLVESIGEGGFGSVWRARDDAGRLVAIKFLKPHMQGEMARRFAREAAILARLSHPNCVDFLEFEPADPAGRAWLVTEFVAGVTLQDWIGPDRTVDENIDVASQIATALDAAHRAGVIHRDLKPANVVVSEREGRPHVTVLDFGIGKLLHEEQGDITATGEVLGTPGFMSPEQLRGHRNIGPPSDLYCLGALVFQMFEHRAVFIGDSALEIAMKHLTEPAPPMSRAAPAAVRELVAALLAKDSSDRPGSADLALRALRARPRAGVEPGPAALPEPPARRRGGVAVVVSGVGLLLVVAVAAWLLAPGDHVEPVDHMPQLTRPNPLAQPVETEVDEELAEPARDTGDSPIVLPGSPGCGKPRVGKRYDEDDRSVIVLPSGYDPNLPLPLLVLLREDGQSAEGILEETRFEPMADRERFAIFAPQYDHDGAQAIPGEVRRVLDFACIDPQRIFLFGHGRGGDIADRIAGEAMFAAIATSSHRLERSDWLRRRAMNVSSTTPYLLLTPTNDRFDRLIGGSRVDHPDHESLLRTEHRCERRTVMTHQVEGAMECRTWDCQTRLRSCRIDGNRHWPGYIAPKKGERGAPSDFDHRQQVWRFFERVSPRRLVLPAGTDGCGRQREGAKRHQFQGPDNVLAYVPRDYDERRRYPVVVALRENQQTVDEMLDEVALEALANERRFIVAAPRAPKYLHRDKRSWQAPGAAAAFWRAVDQIEEQLCVDPSRLYVVGHAASGPLVEELRRSPRLAALATFSHRLGPGEYGRAEALDWLQGEPESIRPYLGIFPLSDPADPAAGDDTVLSIDDSVGRLVEQHRCEGKQPYVLFATSRCWAWDCSAGDLVTCRINGTRHWPGDPNGASSDFDHQRVLWEFFEQYRAPAQSE